MKRTVVTIALITAISLAAGTGPTLHAATVTPFATGVYDELYGLTSDIRGLYVTGSTAGFRDFNGNNTDGVVGKIPFATGKLTTLYSKAKYATLSGHVTPFQITTDGAGGLFWADPDAGPSTGSAFISGTIGGAAPTQFFGICCGPAVLPGDGTGFAFWRGELYFSDSTGGRIGKGPSGSSATQIGPTRYTPDFSTESWSQIAVANGKIFIADSAESRGVDSSGRAIVVDVSSATTITPGIRWISVDGSSGFVDLSVGKILHPIGIVAVGKLLYVSAGRAVWQIEQATGRTTKYATDPRFLDLQGITFARGALYVADSQIKFGPFVNGVATAIKDRPGIIWKIAP